MFDVDTGPNDLQNFPVLTGAAVNGRSFPSPDRSTALLRGAYRVEFFATNAGGVQRYLGTTTVPVGAAGTATFLANVTAAVAVGETITATATNLSEQQHLGTLGGRDCDRRVLDFRHDLQRRQR